MTCPQAFKAFTWIYLDGVSTLIAVSNPVLGVLLFTTDKQLGDRPDNTCQAVVYVELFHEVKTITELEYSFATTVGG